MKYVWTTINTDDLETSILFIRDCRSTVVRRFKLPMERLLSSGRETLIELIKSANPAPKVGPGISLGFAVDSLEETLSF